jgi:hypothetical protein
VEIMSLMRKQQGRPPGSGKAAACGLALVLALLAGPRGARADITVPSAFLPPVAGGYQEAVPVDYNYFGTTIELTNLVHSVFTNAVSSFSGGNETVSFLSTVTAQVSVNGVPQGLYSVPNVPVTVLILGRTSDTQLGSFDTQMQSLDINTTIAGHSAEINLDPNHTTAGHTTVSDAGGGQFKISSFFDVFTEISLDSGPFVPQTSGPTHVTLNATPEPGGLALAALGCASLAGWRLARRRSAAARLAD